MSKQKTVIDIEVLINELANRLTKQSKLAGIQKIYEVTIKKNTTPIRNTNANLKKGGKVMVSDYSTLSLIMVDLETHERVVLFTNDYIFNNPAERLTSNYKRKMYIDLMYNCFAVFSINIANTIRQQRSEEYLDSKDLVSMPVTPDEAFVPEVVEEGITNKNIV